MKKRASFVAASLPKEWRALAKSLGLPLPEPVKPDDQRILVKMIERDHSEIAVLRRQLREARFALRFIEDSMECTSQEFDREEGPMDCNELASDSPCAICSARRALKNIAALRSGEGKRGEG